MFDSFSDFIPNIVSSFFVIATVMLPIFLWNIFWKMWVESRQQKFFNKQKYTLFKIILPKEILKTPSAMEALITTLHQTSGESTWYDRNFLGKTRTWFSLEMVSIEGEVRFYIWTRDSMKKFLESQIYAQYPGIEVGEAKDYVVDFSYDPDKNEMWGTELQLTMPDPFPIKTYVDYGIGDDMSKEEEVKVDPITPTIELLGSIGQKQQMWIQVICRAHKDDEDPVAFGNRIKKFWKELNSKGFNDAWKNFWKGQDNWKEQAKAEVEKIKKSATPSYKDDKGEERAGFPNYTKMQTEIIGSLERSTAKLGFDVGVRGIYLATNKEFYDPSNQGGLVSIWKQYGSHNLNGFKPKNNTSFDFPWQDFFGGRLISKKKDLLEAYKARGYFFEPYKETPLVLNSEELATIYHFPGQVVQTPSFNRVQSKKAEAPANLPI
jgi:hypothetical protein